MAGIAHRCSRCETRHTFAHRWDSYARAKRCRSCRHTKFYVDRWMARRKKGKPCTCDGYHFPHRRGSLHCNYYAGPLSQEDEAPRRFARGWR